MPHTQVFLAILVALVVGYVLAAIRFRLSQKQNAEPSLPWSRRRYQAGLTYLLNDQRDQSLDSFISSMEVTEETFDTHIAFGGLLRRRGDISRAIQVHQSLLESALPQKYLHSIEFELAVDYQSSGLLDRAERIFVSLVAVPLAENDVRRQALTHLLEIYQEWSDWLKAIDIADQLTEQKFASDADVWRELQAQYACEIAASEKVKQNWSDVTSWARKALRYDPECARAHLILAEVAVVAKNYSEAISVLKLVQSQKPALSSETLGPLHECYSHLGRLSDFHEDMAVLYQENQQLLFLEYLANVEEECFGRSSAITLLMRELPKFRGMQFVGEIAKVVDFDSSGAPSEKNTAKREPLYRALKAVLHVDHKYQCQLCGFESEHSQWCCPSCKQWSSVILR